MTILVTDFLAKVQTQAQAYLDTLQATLVAQKTADAAFAANKQAQAGLITAQANFLAAKSAFEAAVIAGVS